MADKRPGGLTALAVLNFIGGGLLALGSCLGLLGMAVGADKVLEEMAKSGADVSAGMIYFDLLLSAVSAGLLISCGVGYLKQKKFLGRTLGNGYAVLSIFSTVLALVVVKTPFGVGTIIGLVYPVLTLALINMTFKDDLVN